jgi:hypothetical protein
MNTVPASLVQAVAQETSGEMILWADGPDARALCLRGFTGSWWFGIPWTGFAVFWTWGAAGGLSDGKHSPPPFFILWGLMFVGIGCAVLLSPLFAYFKAGRTCYVVTKTRAIIFEKTWSLKIRSFEAPAVARFERVSHGANGGDIIFSRSMEPRGRGTRLVETGFMAVADYKSAEAALKRMLELTGAPVDR